MAIGLLLRGGTEAVAARQTVLHAAHAAQPAFEILGFPAHPFLGDRVGENEEPIRSKRVEHLLCDRVWAYDRPGRLTGELRIRVEHWRIDAEGCQQEDSDSAVVVSDR